MQFLVQSYPDIEAIAMQYIPRVGYVISCKEISVVPNDFQFQFEDETSKYYKVIIYWVRVCYVAHVIFQNEKCRELDEDFGDLHGYIIDLQQGMCCTAILFSFT